MKRKLTNATIEVRGTEITVIHQEDEDFISLADMARNFDGGPALIEQWLKNKDTVLFLGVSWNTVRRCIFNWKLIDPQITHISADSGSGRNNLRPSA